MNLQQLEYLKKIAETENFTTAASAASVTQPALSKAISKLEEELNVPLFERNGRNVTLTPFGEVFLRHAEIALSEIEKGIIEIQDMLHPDNSTISIAFTFCIGAYFIPFIISDFSNNFPNTKFQFNNQSNSEILRDLKNGKIHLGFYDDVSEAHNFPEIESIAVKKQEYVLIVPKKHPIANETEVSLKDLKGETFIVFNEGNKDKMLSYKEFLDYTTQISVEPNQANMLSGLVAAGAGITIVPNTPLINTNALSVIKIKEDIGYKTIYMGWLKNSYMSTIAKKFKDYIISSIS
ncbi:LysR family transcriptional regulator [Inconstantimicrobium mannanitabidum]|uniref:LysR family transcriptional regulator n=1 Tax=Inconstantimicrobium mannanitabidum TaxID=1604901 RepID=A0ACB5RE84_9CLOT|nr:LysR family transcriptional regulator [Clostridium sp. TW13]GKX67348.1 LysR family transcriptional regulator [Clostridium sp. TW13]